MIHKEPNNPQINRLRVIHKFESYYKLVFKFHWPHQATPCVKKMDHLGETNGSPVQDVVQTIVLLDEIITEIRRL